MLGGGQKSYFLDPLDCHTDNIAGNTHQFARVEIHVCNEIRQTRVSVVLIAEQYLVTGCLQGSERNEQRRSLGEHEMG